MITAETVNGIVRFQANGLPVVSSADPIATPVAEIRSSAEGVMQEALIDQLEARREELLRRLGQPHRTNGS